jgi:hypothetical protein
MIRIVATTALITIMSLACARAQDSSGQFPGVYVLQGKQALNTSEDRENLELKCVLAPGVMGEGGVGAGYFVDRELFRATGQVSYIKGQEYRCRYTAEKRMETCDSKELSDGKVLHYYRSNVYLEFTPMLQRGHSLFTPEDVVAWNLHSRLNPDTAFAYHRCTCLASDKITALASSTLNPLSSDITGQRMYWWQTDPTEDDYSLARDVLKKLGGCKVNVS